MLIRAWVWLMGLSLGATALALAPPALPAGLTKLAGLAILAISGLKAAIILSDYLELRHAPAIQRGFRAGIGLFLVLAAGLYLAG